MSWDYEESLERVQRAYDATKGLTVGEVQRKTDLENTTLTHPKRIIGAHFYVDVPSYRTQLAYDPIDDESTGGGEDLLHQSHLWAREASRVVETDFDATKVHFQGPKLHGLAYRPIGDDEAMVVKAVLTVAAIVATGRIFNEVLELDQSAAWRTAAGVDFGEALVTANGVRGDRELLFLGNPANRAAKIIDSKGIRITLEAAALLPEAFDNYIAETSDPDIRAIALDDDRLEELVEEYRHGWSREATRKRLKDALAAYPPGSATVYQATVKIDKAKLGMSNTKRVNAVSLFADVDGFTRYVEDADQAGLLAEAVRAYHAIRSEMRHATVQDYEALRVQYQGDRVQALAYLPFDDEDKAALRAVKAAAALHSAVAEVLPQVIGADAAKPLAIGLAGGNVLVSKLGEHGNRDVVSLGTSTADAARIQGCLNGGQTGLDKVVYGRLPKWLQELFSWDSTARAYVSSDLTLDEIERAESVDASARAKSASSVSVASTVAYASASAAEPIRPYCSDC
ncbi:hypothetical protein DLE60_03425 [Micromonospora globispora]|uniref:hypothetical protein n=1 Tax=Micromonospora globispora TaxID=1450148 RepID=UPI000D700FF2|nr:hypothetical protein [Micromonospora globispora]PWU61860.1 hypothetical protein DLE60_03425 [Micromonospora globispora]RQW98457.1 hypothetical protein DKL51_10410 [Micromonospora globispora]